MIGIKTPKLLHNWGNIFNINTFFDSITKSRIQNPIKSLWWSFFAKIVNNFQLLTFFAKKPHHKCQTVLSVKKKETYCLILFYILLYDFINCSAFQTLNKLCVINQRQNKYNQRDKYFLRIVPYVFFAFLRWIKFCSDCFRHAFFHLEVKKKWSLFELDRRSSCTVTIVREFAWAGSVLVVLQRRSFEQV